MVWTYGQSSMKKRDSCDPALIRVMDLGLKMSPVDIAIVWGWRGQEVQDGLYRMGSSKVQFPDSMHNYLVDDKPNALAFDFGPWVNGRIPWGDTHLFALVAGVFFGAAQQLSIKLRWGGDWDMDGLTIDQTFMDWGHLEGKDLSTEVRV